MKSFHAWIFTILTTSQLNWYPWKKISIKLEISWPIRVVYHVNMVLIFILIHANLVGV